MLPKPEQEKWRKKGRRGKERKRMFCERQKLYRRQHEISERSPEPILFLSSGSLSVTTDCEHLFFSDISVFAYIWYKMYIFALF